MKEVKDMSIADVLEHPLFKENMKVVISELENTRRIAGYNGNLKRHPIDRLMERGVLEPERMTDLFAKVMDKVDVDFSSNERRFIHAVGLEAFGKTMKKLMQNDYSHENRTCGCR